MLLEILYFQMFIMNVGINVQSYVDIITNSSTTIFCTIESRFKNVIDSIKNYLNSFLPCKVYISHITDDSKDTYVIWFDIDINCEAEFYENYYATIKQLITEHFPNGGYIITHGEDYN